MNKKLIGIIFLLMIFLVMSIGSVSAINCEHVQNDLKDSELDSIVDLDTCEFKSIPNYLTFPLLKQEMGNANSEVDDNQIFRINLYIKEESGKKIYALVKKNFVTTYGNDGNDLVYDFGKEKYIRQSSENNPFNYDESVSNYDFSTSDQSKIVKAISENVLTDKTKTLMIKNFKENYLDDLEIYTGAKNKDVAWTEEITFKSKSYSKKLYDDMYTSKRIPFEISTKGLNYPDSSSDFEIPKEFSFIDKNFFESWVDELKTNVYVGVDNYLDRSSFEKKLDSKKDDLKLLLGSESVFETAFDYFFENILVFYDRKINPPLTKDNVELDSKQNVGTSYMDFDGENQLVSVYFYLKPFDVTSKSDFDIVCQVKDYKYDEVIKEISFEECVRLFDSEDKLTLPNQENVEGQNVLNLEMTEKMFNSISSFDSYWLHLVPKGFSQPDYSYTDLEYGSVGISFDYSGSLKGTEDIITKYLKNLLGSLPEDLDSYTFNLFGPETLKGQNENKDETTIDKSQLENYIITLDDKNEFLKSVHDLLPDTEPEGATWLFTNLINTANSLEEDSYYFIFTDGWSDRYSKSFGCADGVETGLFELQEEFLSICEKKNIEVNFLILESSETAKKYLQKCGDGFSLRNKFEELKQMTTGDDFKYSVDLDYEFAEDTNSLEVKFKTAEDIFSSLTFSTGKLANFDISTHKYKNDNTPLASMIKEQSEGASESIKEYSNDIPEINALGRLDFDEETQKFKGRLYIPYDFNKDGVVEKKLLDGDNFVIDYIDVEYEDKWIKVEREASSSSEPGTVALILDDSGSMAGEVHNSEHNRANVLYFAIKEFLQNDFIESQMVLKIHGNVKENMRSESNKNEIPCEDFGNCRAFFPMAYDLSFEENYLDLLNLYKVYPAGNTPGTKAMLRMYDELLKLKTIQETADKLSPYGGKPLPEDLIPSKEEVLTYLDLDLIDDLPEDYSSKLQLPKVVAMVTDGEFNGEDGVLLDPIPQNKYNEMLKFYQDNNIIFDNFYISSSNTGIQTIKDQKITNSGDKFKEFIENTGGSFSAGYSEDSFNNFFTHLSTLFSKLKLNMENPLPTKISLYVYEINDDGDDKDLIKVVIYDRSDSKENVLAHEGGVQAESNPN